MILGKGCVDQEFAVRQLSKKNFGVNKEVCMDLEISYDRIYSNALWQVLRIFAVGDN